MSWLNLLGVALGLAMDAFAVSVAAGLTLSDVTPRHTFRLAFHFGLFQFLMPVVGWAAGGSLAARLVGYDHWAAFLLLSFVGGKMLVDAWKENELFGTRDPTRGIMLVTLSVATSIDALAVGLSMAFLHVSVWVPSVVIGLVAAALSAIGIRFGAYFGAPWQRWAELAGGGILVLIGARILILHLTS